MWCRIFPLGVPVPPQCFLHPLTPPGFAAPLGTATALANRGHNVAFTECPARSRRKRWSLWALLGMGMSLGPAGRPQPPAPVSFRTHRAVPARKGSGSSERSAPARAWQSGRAGGGLQSIQACRTCCPAPSSLAALFYLVLHLQLMPSPLCCRTLRAGAWHV